MCRKLSGTRPYSVQNHKAELLQQRLYIEIEPFVVGPMLTNAFLDRFLPKPDNALERDTRQPPNFRKIYENAESMRIVKHRGAASVLDEAKIYPVFINCMKELKLCSLEFANTNGRKEMGAYKGLKPGVAAYKKGSGVRQTKISEMEIFIEFKTTLSEDPFNVAPLDPSNANTRNSFVKNTTMGKKILGQIASYAVAQLGSCFRTHTFSVLIVADKARFIRWDRAGAIVSKAINYGEDPTLFAEFFRRFDLLTPEQRGRDTTVSVPTAEELEKAKSGLSPVKILTKSEEENRSRCDKFLNQEFFKFAVQNDTRAEPSYFVGTFLSRNVDSLVGRASRGCAVFDLQRERVCYLKDTWRIDSDVLQREGEIYKILAEHNVPYIAPLVDEGDVANVKNTGPAYSPCVATDTFFAPQKVVAPLGNEVPSKDEDTLSEERPPYTDNDMNVKSSEPYTETSGDRAQVTDDVHVINIPLPAVVSSEALSTSDGVADVSAKVTDNIKGPSLENKAGPSFPGMLAQGEFDTMHRTITQLFANSPWVYPGGSGRDMHCYVHHGLVLDVVGRNLGSFRSTKEMISAIKDAIIAHVMAYEAGILHRDISMGNIVVTHDGRGLLIDWDLAKSLSEKGGVRYGRTGTLEFISAALLQNPTTKEHTYADDLESFLHVTTYVCILYTKSSYTTEEVSKYMSMFDEESTIGMDAGAPIATGGVSKRLALSSRSYIPSNLSFPDRPNLATLLARVSRLFYFIYASFSEMESVGMSEQTKLRIQRMEENFEAQKKEEIASMNKWTGGGGMYIVELFEQVLQGESAWPADDGPRQPSFSIQITLSQMVTGIKTKAQVESQVQSRSRQEIPYPIVMSMPGRMHSFTNEGISFGLSKSLHGEDDPGPPRKKRRMELLEPVQEPPLK